MKLMILDGNSIVNRAYFGIRPLTAPDGTPTNAIYGFLTIFSRLYSELNPDAVAVAFDVHQPTFRHRACESYKAQRKPMPEDLSTQMPVLKELLSEMGIKCYELAGYEADDILGTAASACEGNGWECIVVTGDKDSLQLVSDKTSVCIIKTRAGQTETILYTPEVFRAEYGFDPKNMVDLKALMGDSSDNISGVPGIGEKTAMNLISQYKTIENIYSDVNHLDIKDSVRNKLAAGEESARKSYWLATIFRNVPIEFQPESNTWQSSFKPGLYAILKRLGFNRFIEKWHVTEASAENIIEAAEHTALSNVTITDENAEDFIEGLSGNEYISVFSESDDVFRFCNGKNVYLLERFSCFLSFDSVAEAVFSENVKKLGHNIKDMEKCGGFIFDTALAAYLIASTEQDYSLPHLADKYLGYETGGAEAIFLLYEPLKARLDELGLKELYYSIELPLCSVIADMEKTGFLVDRAALHKFGEDLVTDIEILQQSIYSEAGTEFNINSPKQLGEILFEKLLLPYGKKTKTGWSTGADVLEKLRGLHPIVEDVLEYRMLSKLKSTYTDGLQKVIAEDGRIHSNFKMTATATGRLSSAEPNLQNIPIRKELGSRIRRMFIASPGNVLVDADYSQIELRILAHMAADGNMIDAFLSGEDFHSLTASNVFNVPLKEVTALMRSRAKAVNFGIIYGMSAYSLSQDIKVTTKEAKAYMDAYFDKYSGVAEYMKTVVENARKNGYVTTLYGRRREMPELKNSNKNIQNFGERVALNMPVQGTAADIIKLAMVNVSRRLSEEKLQAKLVLQVHDELIIECPERETEQVCAILKESMENAAKLSVPLTVEVGTGTNWAEAH